jgi:hypothetical protein
MVGNKHVGETAGNPPSVVMVGDATRLEGVLNGVLVSESTFQDEWVTGTTSE